MDTAGSHDDGAWPALDPATLGPTKRSLHLYAQMLGKLRVALSPSQPNWMFTALLLSARGFTTGPMPWRDTALEALLDVFSSEIVIARSTGDERRIALLPVRTVADVYADVCRALAEFHVECEITAVPQEVADTTPFPEDRRPVIYDPAVVRAWFRAATAAASAFDEWRAHFFGRTGIQLWWGALDVSLMLFNGKHVAPPADRGYLLRYDLDAELMNAGLYFGDASTAPFFYGYIHPQPGGADFAAMPAGVSWSDALKEWVLPYDAVRRSPDPPAELSAFLDAIYTQCTTAAGWDAAALRYDAPPRSRRPRSP